MRYVLTLLLFSTCCQHPPRQICGTVTGKVWSHVTGACYAIVATDEDPPQVANLVVDTAEWAALEVGAYYCGKRLGAE